MALLLGGAGSRMGRPKHHLVERASGEDILSFQARRMAPHFPALFLLHGPFEVSVKLPGERVPDLEKYPGQGPLAALLAALQAARTPWVGLLPIDQPQVPPALYQEALARAAKAGRAVVYLDENQKPQWLCGLYHRRLIPELESALSEGVRSMNRFWESKPLLLLPCPDLEVFCNLNTPEQALNCGWELPGSS